jgi:hypothetical protein
MHDRVIEALAAIGTPGRFAVRRTSAPDDLRLEVKGVGNVPLPVSKTRAHKLRSVARPARYGLREQTLLDPQVRDTWEVPRSRVRIDRRRWNQTLLPQLEQIGSELGLPAGCRLKAELHSMLLYEPGQFFAPHQDSEKSDDMVGTLVVLLPSEAKGGALTIEHGSEKVSYRGSTTKLTLIAFYADCRHEVKPLREGHRVALTFNLLRSGEPGEAQVEAGQVDALAAAVKSYFHTRHPPNWRNEEGKPPERLVYLLDHEYTQRSLGWNRLKGQDAARVTALRQVAERLDCGILLALADVHEIWQCEEEDWGHGRYWDDDDTDDDTAHELVDLVDYDIGLSHCLGSEAGQAQIAQGIGQDEVCWTTESDDLEPYAYEYEGYTGNYGNTVDRWYHRAAVVLWPQAHSFALRAHQSAHWALGEVGKRLKAGDGAGARKMAQSLLPFWAGVAAREESARFAARACMVAAALEAPALAAALLGPLRLEQLTPKVVPGLRALAVAYGPAWCLARLQDWDESHFGCGAARSTWLQKLPELCRGLGANDASADAELARELVSRQCAWIRQEWQTQCTWPHPAQRLKALAGMAGAMLGVLESSLIAEQTALHAQLLDFLTAAETKSPLLGLMCLLRAAYESRAGAALPRLGLARLREHCTEALRRRLDEPPRAQGDWSISTQLMCSCELCEELTRFLRAAAHKDMEWPLAQRNRAHVHGEIDDHDLPVTHATRRVGRPYVLVLTKIEALFERDAAERRTWEKELRWLEKTAALD